MVKPPDQKTRRALRSERGRPTGRLGVRHDIAALASSFTTGVAHIIDGGWTL